MATFATDRDILIIGGGIFGAAVAYDLARHGLGKRVLLLERLQPAAGATSRAAALVTQVRDKPDQMALARQTLRTITELEQVYGEDIGRRTVGALHVAPASHWHVLQARADLAAAHGMAFAWLSPADALARAPWLAPAAFDHALFFPDDCFVEPYLLTTALLRVACTLGVRVEVANVARIAVDSQRIRGVDLADGRRLPATTVVNAAGAWANLLSTPVGLPLPMAPVRSQYWITEPSPLFPRDGAIVLMPAVRAYARPEVGALLVGLRERQQQVADPTTLPADLSGFVFDTTDPDGWANLADGADELAPYFPALNTLGMAHYLTGPSNYTPDGQLVVGAAPDIAGLYVASGCNGSGISFAGGVGRLVGELVRGTTPFVDPLPGAPARRGHFDPYTPDFLAACAAARALKTSG
jgi:4-methylaminobutanoate oxidase (formaldehyde-forming)